MNGAAADRRFEALIFDWDGTAVPDRTADATRVRQLIEALVAHNMRVFVVSGTHVGNVDGQLRARPSRPGRLFLCLNRGSEVFAVDADGPTLIHRREATPDEDAALTEAAELTVRKLAARNLRAEIVSQRLNRRKIDVIPLPEWADPPKAQIGDLLDAVVERLHANGFSGLPEVVAVALDTAKSCGLKEARVTSDAKHVEIGLTDKADSARWAFAELAREGIAPAHVLIAGDELGPLGGLTGSDSLMLIPEARRATVVSVGPEPTGVPDGVHHIGGGPDAFCAILADQLERRVRKDPPEVDDDPEWSLVISDGVDPILGRVHESLMTIADGEFGTSATPPGVHHALRPRVLAGDVYRGANSTSELLTCPLWHHIPFDVAPTAKLRRVLDLRTGTLAQHLADRAHEIGTVMFSSLDSPGNVALRAKGKPKFLPRERNEHVRVTEGSRTVALALEEEPSDAGDIHRMQRLGAYVVADDREGAALEAKHALHDLRRRGYERALDDHRRAWAQRWDEADIRIEGDARLQRDVRFALYHLMSSVPSRGEAAVGARGLTGRGYRGHVFWDADVFVLPFFAATHPDSARAMLEYRYLRLDAAREVAASMGYRGARFPWESAADGKDVTPRSYRDHTGKLRLIRTGFAEEHIIADIAWAATQYIDWTNDEVFASGAGRELLTETARWWASRIRRYRDNSGHILGVIGPDEYHEPVDDNAYTNVMARWNLFEAARRTPDDAEAREWLAAARSLVDGYDPRTHRYEQFAGYYDLEPLLVSDVSSRRPIATDVLLGPERTAQAQIIKQADVLMLHHLVPDAVAEGSLHANLDFYEPRTAHGSSLSPGIHAALFARAGRPDEAMDMLRTAATLDLDDVTHTTAMGIHLATVGTVWQAIAFGFAGVRAAGGVLRIDPVPMPGLAYELRLVFQGVRVRVRVEPDEVSMSADAPVRVMFGKERIARFADQIRRTRGLNGWESR